MRIALWNGSGINNVGDRLIDAVTRKELQARIPEGQFQSFSPWPGSFTQQRLTIDRDGYWNAHGQFDAIVIGGGALITGPPFSDPAAQFFLFGPYPERFQDSALVVWNSMCSDGQTLAPTEERWRTFVCSAASRASLISVRNSRTCSFLRECGVTLPITVVPDVAVLAAEPSERPRTRKKLRIGIAPGRPVFPENFLAEIAANAFTNAGVLNQDVMRKIRYCPPARFNDDEYAAGLAHQLEKLKDVDLLVLSGDSMYGDSITAGLVAQKLNDSTCIRLDDPLGSDAISIMRSLDCVIAFRLHACIMALAVGTPFVAVDMYRSETIHTSKLNQLMQDIGFESRYLTLDELISSKKSLCSLVEDAVCAGSDPVVQAHSLLVSRARAHFDTIAETIATRAVVPALV